MQRHLARYAAVGLIGTGIHFATLIFFVSKTSLDPTTSSTVGFIFALVISYLLNHRWTFACTRGYMSGFARYTATSTIGLLLNIATMYILNSVFHLWYISAQIVVIAIVPPINFIINKYWTFSGNK